MGAHSVLSPSGSHRWLRCVAAPAACAHLPEERTSKDAALGTAKHAISERCLREDIPSAAAFLGQSVQADNFTFTVDAEFVDHVDTYIEAVRREPGIKLYERALNTSEVLGVPEQKGTADAVILDPERRRLIVMDAKFGFHRVDAADNSQGLLYIAAARREFAHVAEWVEFQFIIVQPRIAHYDPSPVYTVEYMEKFEEYAASKAPQVMALMGRPREEIVAAMTPSPEACEWCEIRGSCERRANSIAQLFEPVETVQQPPVMTCEELAAYLPRLADIESWCKDVAQEAYSRAMNGQAIPGYKLIEAARKGNRFWKDPKTVTAALIAQGLPESALYHEPELKSPSDVEKLAKARKLKVEGLKSDDSEPLVGQLDGKPQLVPESAKGTPYAPKQLQFEADLSAMV